MTWLAQALAVAGFAVSLRSAWLWYQASRVAIDPGWKNGRIEPVVAEQAQADWTAAMLVYARRSGELNSKGAFWTAIAVLFSAAAALVGAI